MKSNAKFFIGEKTLVAIILIYVFLLVVLPRIHLSGPSHTLREGDSVNLTCNVTAGFPKPQLRWSRNGEKLNEGSSVLLLREVSEKDAGRYTCEATNAGGSTDQHVQINVQSRFI